MNSPPLHDGNGNGVRLYTIGSGGAGLHGYVTGYSPYSRYLSHMSQGAQVGHFEIIFSFQKFMLFTQNIY